MAHVTRTETDSMGAVEVPANRYWGAQTERSLHNPAHVQGMRAAMHKWPSLPQVALFDTAFHSTMPEEAWWSGTRYRR